MKRRALTGLVVVIIVVSAVLVGAAAARQADIVLPINAQAPQGITCADGGVLSPVVDETVQPIGNRFEVWCLPFHPEGK